MIEANIRLIDPNNIPDTFATGLADVEAVGGDCFRFVFYTLRYIGNAEELVIAERLVLPMCAIPPGIVMAAKAVGYSVATGAYFPRIGLN